VIIEGGFYEVTTMAAQTPFSPQAGSNQVLTAGAVALFTTLHPVAKSVRVVNSGANIGYVRIGENVTSATTADVPVRALSEVILNKGDGENSLAYISALGTTLQVQTGEGGV